MSPPLMLLALAAHAEDPKFEGTAKEAEELEKPEAHLAAALGGALTAGNTATMLLNARFDGSYKWKMNRFTLDLGANYGRSVVDADANGHLDDTERAVGAVDTAKRGFADGRYDRFFSDKDSLYALAGAYTDKFAGYDWRTHGQLGYSRILVANDTVHLLAELGADVARENYVAGVDPNEAWVLAARGFVGLDVTLSENAKITETVEVFENVVDPADMRLLNNLGLTAKLSDKFSLNVSHQLAFDNVPVEGFRKADHLVMVTFVASIL
jgi:putative salt-induced outer membrane protein YdiY